MKGEGPSQAGPPTHCPGTKGPLTNGSELHSDLLPQAGLLLLTCEGLLVLGAAGP